MHWMLLLVMVVVVVLPVAAVTVPVGVFSVVARVEAGGYGIF